MTRAAAQSSSGRDAWLHGRAWWAWLGALALGTLLVALVGNGGARGLDRSETFVARVPTEMARRADAGEPHAWLVPYFNGAVRLQKPPMNYWLAMGAHRLLGERGSDIVGAFEARLPSALGGVAAVFVSVWCACVVFCDRRAGLLAGALLATCVGFLTESHHARPEMVYAFFTTGMAACFVRGLRAEQEGERGRAWWLGAWACFAAASLTKGPHIPALVVGGCVVALLLRERGRTLRVVRPLPGLALALGAAGAWFYLIHRAEPEALRFWFGEVFNRTGWIDPEAAGERSGSPWWLNPLTFFYVRATVQVAAPWCLLLVGAAMLPWRRRDDAGARAMVLWWGAVLPLAALSFSSFMRAQYVAPVLPLLLMLMAGEAVALIDRWGRDDPRPGLLRALHFVHAAAALALCAAAAVVVVRHGARSPALPHAGAVSCAIAGLGGAVALAGLVRARANPVFAVASLPAAVALAMVAGSVSGSWWSDARGARAAFAREVGRLAPEGTPLVAMGGETAVIVYYADRTVAEVGGRAELEEVLRRRPDTLLMTRPRTMEREGVSGLVVAEERKAGDSSPMVLVAEVRLVPRPER